MINELIIYKFIKFCAVGFSGMIVDFGVTWILKEKIRINKYIANSTGFILAATSNYIWNHFWTFRSQNDRIAQEYITFIIISLVGLALNNLLIYLFSDRMKLNFYLSKLFAIAIVTIWNFIMNFLFTFV